MSASKFDIDLGDVLQEIGALLMEKNRKYGDAALNPKRTFSRASPAEGIRVRIDDKLSRIANRQTDEDEDPEFDLLGYLILLRIAKLRESRGESRAPGLHP